MIALNQPQLPNKQGTLSAMQPSELAHQALVHPQHKMAMRTLQKQSQKMGPGY